MIEPCRAAVRPRVVSPVTGETLLLEDEILSLVERKQQAVVWLTGGPGSGKTTALAHLAAVLPPSAGVTLLDDTEQPFPKPESRSERPDAVVILLWQNGTQPKNGIVFQLAPWTDDELIEYLLAVHRDRCRSVMGRCGSPGEKQLLSGNPELWRRTLDALAADEGLASIKAGLQRVIELQMPAADVREMASDWCMTLLLKDAFPMAENFSVRVERLCESPILVRLFSHRPVVLLLAAERIAGDLQSSGPCGYLKIPLLEALIEETASLIREDSTALSRLRDMLIGGQHLGLQPMAASLIHAAGADWQPERQVISGRRKWLRRQKIVIPNLAGAILYGACWPRIDLSRMKLTGSDLSGADLAAANLDDADAVEAKLRGAKMTGASLGRLHAERAQLAGADLSYIRAEDAQFQEINAHATCFEGALLIGATFRGADLAGATFARANLKSACFSDAQIEGASFSRADLTEGWFKGLPLNLIDFSQCCFHKALLDGCDLEGMSLPGADFTEARLVGALLTETTMPRANFRGAKLTNTGLAEIDWERADLRDADLRGASFHMGSSRSGLVDSTIASFGSRTGFYTDDYNEQDFKSPEEIRKANLRGADLRGAKIEGVDFYLVDLRDALYDAHQEQHFRGCGAILETRAV